MNGGEFRPYRHVFPVRQDVDGDEVDGVIDLAVLQPEFPDIGIGHGHARGLRFHGRMLATRSAVVISPRSKTSLPTTSEVMTPG